VAPKERSLSERPCPPGRLGGGRRVFAGGVGGGLRAASAPRQALLVLLAPLAAVPVLRSSECTGERRCTRCYTGAPLYSSA
jgi:hypothetical protein